MIRTPSLSKCRVALPAFVGLNRHDDDDNCHQVLSTTPSGTVKSRRSFLFKTSAITTGLVLFSATPVQAKCTDIDSCRAIGEAKEAADLAANPIVRLGGGLQYKVLNAGVGDAVVSEQTAVVKLAYSISQASGIYMYSQGFGYNKIDAGNGQLVSDLGLDALTVHLQDAEAKEVPVGIQRALQSLAPSSCSAQGPARRRQALRKVSVGAVLQGRSALPETGQRP